MLLRKTLSPILAALLVMAACGGEDENDSTGGTTAIPTPGLPVEVVGADGVPVTVTDASRIVTLSGDFSEIVWELGLGDNLVGVDLSSIYPEEEMAAIPKVGVEFLLVAEPIIALEPTVVIGDIDARPPQVIEQVRAAGIPVIIFDRRVGIDAPVTKILETSEVLGVGQRGAVLAERVRADIAVATELAGTAPGRPRVVVLYIANRGSTLLLLGENSVADGIIEAIGAEDVAPAAGGSDPFVPLTAEALVAAAPDVIITATRGMEAIGGIEAFLELPGVAQTPAGRDRQILVYEDLYLLGLGPRTGLALQEVVTDLHPTLADDR